MAEFKISRFRYTWKGEWDTAVATYLKDDVVYYRGSAWVCIRQHSPTVFSTDQAYTPAGETNAVPAWVKSVDGREWLGDWTNNLQYDPGTLVLAGGNVYLCVAAHVSATNFNSDTISWELFATGSNFRNTWAASTRYRVGDVIRYNGYTYQCVLEHLSGTISEGVEIGNDDNVDDSTFETWSIVVENYTYIGEFQPSTVYRKNDLVKYGGSILKCIADHTASSTIDDLKFETYLPGFNYYNNWNSATQYAVGDVVRQGGTIYVSATNNFNQRPGVLDGYSTGNPNWTIINKATSFAGEYDPGAGKAYNQGDLIRRGGSLWVSLTNQVSNEDSSLAIFDDTNWQLVIASYGFQGAWHPDVNYNLYDVVYYRGIVYYCSTPHNSTFSDFPGDNGEGYNYWTILIVGDENAALTNLGDLISYNLYRDVLFDDSTTRTIGDGSTFGRTALPIGTTDQLLVVENNQGDIGYKTWGNIQRVFHVRTNGVDDDTDPNRGINYFKPWKTIKYALEHADDGYTGHTSVLVSTGEYQEILPLIVPAKTAVVGEELRSASIKANDPNDALASDVEYVVETLVRISILLNNIILGIPVTPSAGNITPQNTSSVGTSLQVPDVSARWGNIIDTIEYKVNSIGSMPAVFGTNTPAGPGSVGVINSLENNREFIKAEAIAYMAVENPAYSFSIEKWQRDFDRFINAVQYDLEYTGNYKSVLAGRHYANEVIGSALEDMFYVRDATGVRNLTLKGLEGTLPAVVAGSTYSIPTGGAFVSLDPGWGAADTRTWITTRSPYIQNVTTFGYGAIGQKVDGALHNGGNKSIVSNDFTQVISDGIGAWMVNGGRGELVSVFSYYAHVGMFAKNGGIIRATNGNSSYGDFGAVADGVDPTETVRYGYLNTRTEQAQIYSAFAGEILDYILGLEFANCGQGYTQASYSITSSGVGAVAIQEEFRDNAMFECQTLSGGSGFTQYGNQAQLGDQFSIILASSETATQAQILGMRIIIISGEGTGQYGYVYSYNSGTKVCVVYRESDDQPGWDHILPGTPSNPLLTTGTRYRIEPRITFSEPEYSATSVTLTSSIETAAIVYGETSETFSIAASAGNQLNPVAAIFSVVKTGRTYSVTLVSGGSGYAVGDIITIDGSGVGGVTIEHDITLTAVTVSETGTLLTYTLSSSNIANSGKFIITPAASITGKYSSNGTDWVNFSLPASGNWKCLASGDNKFVAIANDSLQAASSTDGITWTSRSMPASRLWNAVVYGKPSDSTTGVFVAVAGNLNSGAISTNGTTWTTTTLPVGDDSTINEWVDIAFGFNRFVALANSNNSVAVGTYDSLTNTISWEHVILDVIADSSSKDWVSIAYGNRRFVAMANTGEIAYSFDGLVWYPTTMPTQDGSTVHNWKQIRYGQGVFMAVGDTGARDIFADITTGPTLYIVTSYDGIVWSEKEAATSKLWGRVAFGNPDTTLGDSTISNNSPTWIIAPSDNSDNLNIIKTGARALGRVAVAGIGVSYIKIWEPGSGYNTDSSVTVSVYNPGITTNPGFRTRTSDGVLAQPTFVTKGVSYKTSTTVVTVLGDGFADITPRTKFLTLDGLTRVPGPGAQFYIRGRSSYYVAVQVGINEQQLPDGSITCTFQISPQALLADYFEHGQEVLIREKYSQVRITGHDFLDIGSGNFVETNYPDLYTNYDYNQEPFQEVENYNGGRVFFTSTDQDGNFRAGDQFAVEQATAIVTISADFFDLAGLTELRLGGITVGSTAVIREFSKDPLFLQNSNNIIPTQRAVRSYLGSRLNIGGEDLLTPAITAGTVRIGPNLIDNTADLTIDIVVLADFRGAGAGVSGSMLAQTMFYRSFSSE